MAISGRTGFYLKKKSGYSDYWTDFNELGRFRNICSSSTSFFEQNVFSTPLTNFSVPNQSCLDDSWTRIMRNHRTNDTDSSWSDFKRFKRFRRCYRFSQDIFGKYVRFETLQISCLVYSLQLAPKQNPNRFTPKTKPLVWQTDLKSLWDALWLQCWNGYGCRAFTTRNSMISVKYRSAKPEN